MLLHKRRAFNICRDCPFYKEQLQEEKRTEKKNKINAWPQELFNFQHPLLFITNHHLFGKKDHHHPRPTSHPV